jgi:hypothetical protein
MWTVNDVSINLDEVSLVPPKVVNVIPVGNILNSNTFPEEWKITANMLLLPMTLPIRTELSFTLTVNILEYMQGSWNSVQASSSVIKVRTNGPPVPGTFSVFPSVGIELQTNFLLAAAFWTDENPPLFYEFSFMPNFPSSVAHLTLLAKSSSSHGMSILPSPNSEFSNQSLCLVLFVSDILGANSSASEYVVVEKVNYFSTC